MSNGGPTTNEGKAISSRNAISHGVLAKIPVIPGLEREEDWEAHRAGVLASLAPEGHLESVLAERVALQLWRVQRVARYEALTIATAQETVEEDVTRGRQYWRRPEGSPAAKQARAAQEREAWQVVIQTFQRFLAMADDDLLLGSDPEILMSVVEAVCVHVTCRDVPIPFMPQGETIESYALWTAGKLRWLFTVIANAEGQELNQLLEMALRKAILQFAAANEEVVELAARAEQEQAEVAVQVSRLQRLRILPSDTDREKIARYEAHLSRELYKAMHELEALQERRRGRPAPLARLDITDAGENTKLRNELTS